MHYSPSETFFVSPSNSKASSKTEIPFNISSSDTFAHELHQKALAAAQKFRQTKSELMAILEQVEQHRVFLHRGHPSLFQYATQELLLSENTAYILITVMRKAKEVPALKTKIASGSISLSNARKISAVITPENQQEWLEKASTLTQRQLEKEIVKVRPQSAVTERAQYITEQRLKLELGISETHLLKLRRVQDLICKTRSKHASLEDALIEMAEFYLHHKDPVMKAKRVIAQKGTTATKATNPHKESATQKSLPTKSEFPPQIEELTTTRLESSSPNKSTKQNREPIPTNILHQVHLRDGGKCTQLRADHRYCGQTRWTEIHHIKPVSEGGKNTLENLTTLCSTHHRWLHQKQKLSS